MISVSVKNQTPQGPQGSQPTDFGEHDFVVLPRVGGTIELDGYGHVPVVLILHTPGTVANPPTVTIYVTI